MTTYDLDAVAAAINAVAPEMHAYVSFHRAVPFGEASIVYHDGDIHIQGPADRAIARIVLDELDRQDATVATAGEQG